MNGEDPHDDVCGEDWNCEQCEASVCDSCSDARCGRGHRLCLKCLDLEPCPICADIRQNQSDESYMRRQYSSRGA